jgi:hypothetical protein
LEPLEIQVDPQVRTFTTKYGRADIR